MKKILLFSKFLCFLCFGHIAYSQTLTVPTVLGSTTQTICAGKSTYFGATCATGTPKWYNAIRTTLLGSGETFFTPTINSNINYTVRCETNTVRSNHVLLTVNMTNATNISTDISLSESCFGASGQNITLTANPTNVGTNPKYFWAKNGEPLGMFYLNPLLEFDTWGDEDSVNDIHIVDTDEKVYVCYSNSVEIIGRGAGRTLQKNSGFGFSKIDVEKNGVIYVASYDGLLKASPSDNYLVNTGLSGRTNCVKVDKNGVIYVGTNDSGIAISKDGGNTFSYKTTADGLGSNIIYDIFITEEGKIYVANPLIGASTTRSGFSYSTDGGETFHSDSKKNNNFASDFANDIFVDGKGKVYVATDNGLSISTDGGLTFTNKTKANGLVSSSISSVFVSNNGDIYAGCRRLFGEDVGGLCLSTNGGDSFVSYNNYQGLPSSNVLAVGVVSNGSNSDIWVGTSYGLSNATRNSNNNTLQISNVIGDEYHLSIEPTSGICPVPSFASKRIKIGNIPSVENNETSKNVCVGSSVNLIATCLEGGVNWYDSRFATQRIGIGSPFTVSPTTDKVYYPICIIDNSCESNRNTGTVSNNGTLAVNAPRFFRPKSFTETIEDPKNNVQSVEYQTHSLSVTRAGEHIFSLDAEEDGSISNANANTFLCLYNSNGFSPASPLNNLIAFSTTNTRSITMSDLAVGNYTLVLTRYERPTIFDASPLPWTYRIVQRNTVQSPRVKVYAKPIPTIPTVTFKNITVCLGSSASLVGNCSGTIGGKNTPVWYSQSDINHANPLYSGQIFDLLNINASKSYNVRCESSTCGSTDVGVSVILSTVNDIPNLVANQEICHGTNFTLSSACEGTTYVVWYNADGTVKLFTGNNFTPSTLESSTYYNYVCENSLGCKGTFRTVFVTVKKANPPTGLTNTYTVYKGSSISLNAVCSVGEAIAWYRHSDTDDLLIKLYNGSPFVTPILSSGITYKVACERQDCGISTFEHVNIEVIDPTPAPPIAQANVSIPWGSSTTLTASGCSGSTGVFTLYWYNATDNLGVTMPISPRIISSYYAKCEVEVDRKTYLSNKSSNVELSFNDLITSILSGNWEDSSTWNLNRIPIRTDNVMIDKNHLILLNSNSEVKSLNFGGMGRLKYNTVGVNLRSGGF
jgi:hypothetical protein